MKPIEAKNQVRLGAGRCLQLALTGMSFRLFRSSVTVAILALAVAFLVHMLAYGLLADETQTQAWNALRTDREMGELITRLDRADTRAIIVQQMAGGDEDRLAEYQRWSGLSPEEFDVVRRTAQRVDEAARTLDELPPQMRTGLLGDRLAREEFDLLPDEERFARFVATADQLGAPLPLGSEGEFRTLVTVDRPRLLAVADQIRAGHQAAIEHVDSTYPGRGRVIWRRTRRRTSWRR